jgi:anaerobic selenocysteine-containing dehydrogenase
MNTKREKSKLNPSVNRRTFLKVSGVLASAAMTGPVFTKSNAAAASTGENLPDTIETAEDIIYSTCQMCHSRCGLRAKVKEGILVKIDGNPYHPNNRDVDEGNVEGMPDDANRLPYNTPPGDAFRELGRMCLKGQSGIQTVYDPFRIQHP